MWMNLDQLPIGKSMYTVAVTVDPVGTARDEITYDEVDVVGPSRATAQEVVAAAREEIDRDYESDARIIGVSNQSEGYVVWEDPDGDLR